MKVGFLGLLAILFIALKLTGVVAWSWWLVLLPIYIFPASVLGLFVIAVVFSVIGISVREIIRYRGGW